MHEEEEEELGNLLVIFMVIVVYLYLYIFGFSFAKSMFKGLKVKHQICFCTKPNQAKSLFCLRLIEFKTKVKKSEKHTAVPNFA